MNPHIKYKELQIKIAEGITLIAEVTNKEDVKAVIEDLADLAMPLKKNLFDSGHANDETPDDGPERNLELRAGLSAGSLKLRNILAFKDGNPQLLRPSVFNSISDATLTLIFAVEAGLKTSTISLDDFKVLYDAQNIKSGSQLSMLLNNLKNSGYIDKGQYNNDRTIRLTAKGEKKATEVLSKIGPSQ
jgi:hypothetical protein